jgi:hypothetical protein
MASNHSASVRSLLILLLAVTFDAGELGASAGRRESTIDSAICYDPVSDPGAPGWIREGTQSAFPSQPLHMSDGSLALGDYVTVTCDSPEMFQQDIRLAPSIAIGSTQGPGSSHHPYDETGIHVTIDDGERRVRVTVLNGQGSLLLAIDTAIGWYPAFTLPGSNARFLLWRLADGSARLEVPGQGSLELHPLQLAPSNRPGSHSISFGTLDSLTASQTDWGTLGLPRRGAAPVALPGAVMNAPTDVEVNDYPTSLVTGDVTADGAPDIVFGGKQGASILANDGTGSFSHAGAFPVGSFPGAMVMGDFDADGQPDLAVANTYTASGAPGTTISILLSDGPASFGEPSPVIVAPRPLRLATGDLNQDGTLDLVVMHDSGTTLSILAGDGAGGFGAPAVVAAGIYTRALAVADADGDGDLDVATVGSTDTEYVASVLLNDGMGGLGVPSTFIVGDFPDALAFGDLDADGTPDLAVAAVEEVSVLAGDGTGSFGPRTSIPMASGQRAIAIADLNGDALPDLIVTGPGDGVHVIVATGAGAFAPPVRSLIGPGYEHPVAVRDLNDDGTLDVVVANEESADVSVLLVTRSSQSNRPPVADAGPDQTIECGATVVLNGAGSQDPDGDTLTYTWSGPFPEGGGVVTGRNPSVTLPLGSSTITLVVNDGRADSAPDAVVVTATVQPVGLDAPLAALVPEGEVPPLPKKAFNAGRVLPFRLRLYCGARALTKKDVTPPRIVAARRDGAEVRLAALGLRAGQAFDYERHGKRDGSWLLEAKTKGWKKGTYTFLIEMPDGRRFAAGVVVR